MPDLLLLIFLCPLSLVTLIVLFNFVTAPLYILGKKRNRPDSDCMVSMLVPMRNEEENAAECVRSLLSQDTANFEVIVLDDNSTDQTRKILSELDDTSGKLQVLQGKALPQGWTGKNWACHQLAGHARGTLLIFIDADCRLDPGAVSRVQYLKSKSGADMISLFPTQVKKTFSEQLVIPMMHWILLTFLPLKLVFWSRWKSFTAAIGQFIAIDRETYVICGGHEEVKGAIVDDMALGKLVKSRGYRLWTGFAGPAIQCRMYTTNRQVIEGFTKNFLAAFNFSIPVFSLFLAFTWGVFMAPLFLALVSPWFLLVIILIVLQRIMVTVITRENPLFNVLLFPLQFMMMLIIGIRSILMTLAGTLSWKGRTLAK
jgi:glycosyltransferase involved in cell wall biosynthesis